LAVAIVQIRRGIVCPKCRKEPIQLVEHWTGHIIEFSVKNGMVDQEGNKEMGDPDHVVAVCGCGHTWRVRGISQITEILSDPKA
jgi:hypothetical protein